MPWPQATPARNARPSRVTPIDFANCFVMHTASILFGRAGCPAAPEPSVPRNCSFARRWLRGLLNSGRGGRPFGPSVVGTNRQSALHNQVHSPVDGNPYDPFVLIHPVVGGELAILFLGKLAKL